MRSLIVCNSVSLDGFYEGPGGDVMALNMDEAFDAYNLERISSAGTVLLGRKSFEAMSAYWSQVADAPQDPGNRALSDVDRQTSTIYNTLPKVVVSDTYDVPADNRGRTRARWWRARLCRPGWRRSEAAATVICWSSAEGTCGTGC
jgi:dihydrofolate reductase